MGIASDLGCMSWFRLQGYGLAGFGLQYEVFDLVTKWTFSAKDRVMIVVMDMVLWLWLWLGLPGDMPERKTSMTMARCAASGD